MFIRTYQWFFAFLRIFCRKKAILDWIIVRKVSIEQKSSVLFLCQLLSGRDTLLPKQPRCGQTRQGENPRSARKCLPCPHPRLLQQHSSVCTYAFNILRKIPAPGAVHRWRRIWFSRILLSYPRDEADRIAFVVDLLVWGVYTNLRKTNSKCPFAINDNNYFLGVCIIIIATINTYSSDRVFRLFATINVLEPLF